MAKTKKARKAGTASAGSTTLTISDLKRQPISVVSTELPNLARRLGLTTAELTRSIIGPGGDVGAEQCCHSDSW
jgi:hypothetical protein